MSLLLSGCAEVAGTGSVEVSFGAAEYTLLAGRDAVVTVHLNAEPESAVTIPLTVTPPGAGDYGVPATVTFGSGEFTNRFEFPLHNDLGSEDETITLGFGDLPDGVSPGTLSQAIIAIYAPRVLMISDDAAVGPDYVERGTIDVAGDVDNYKLLLKREFTSVIIMTTGDTDTAGLVETDEGVEVTAPCEREAPAAPCVFSYDPDIAPRAGRSAAFNAMEPSSNFVWEGKLKLAPGTYYIWVTGEDGSTGDYQLTVELNEGSGPMYS